MPCEAPVMIATGRRIVVVMRITLNPTPLLAPVRALAGTQVPGEGGVPSLVVVSCSIEART